MLQFRTLRRVRGPADLRRLDKMTEFHHQEFPSSTRHMESIRWRLLHPLKVDYQVVVVTAEDVSGSVYGFAAYDHFPDLGLSYLEYIVTSPKRRSQGVGGALYQAIRESLLYDGSDGLLFEANADDPEMPPEERQGNAATLRFYEKFDARPLEGIRFDYPPFTSERPRLLLLYDDLGRGKLLDGHRLRAFMRKLYAVKYSADLKDPGARRILASVPEGPLQRRPLRYVKPPSVQPPPTGAERLPLVEAIVSEAHHAHKVPERDYLERPLRVERLLGALRALPFVAFRQPKAFADRHLLEVHDKDMVAYLKNASERLPEGATIYPTVFPIRRRLKPPKGSPTHGGYYSLDSFTPLTSRAYPAARAAVDVALTAAHRLRTQPPDGPVYALTRPPGHHAERDLFGGFCYFNNGAVAAQYLVSRGAGRVALLDVDFHHGNGAQQIFWERDDVLTVSVHGDPRQAYPYFVGFEDEKGVGPGLGYNHNFPLPEGIGDDEYLAALRKALRKVQEHEPDFLVVALGLDVSKDDPSGFFRVSRKGFHAMGRSLAELGIHTMLVQEGGYNLRHLSGNLASFLEGWVHGMREHPARARGASPLPRAPAPAAQPEKPPADAPP